MFSALIQWAIFAVPFVVAMSFMDTAYYMPIGYIKKPRLLSLDPLFP